MNKAEERALEAYPPKLATYSDLFGEETLDNNGLKRAIFIEGYQQAEKDLELTTKEVDLHKEIMDYFNNQPIVTKSGGIDYQLIPSAETIAKHFFELGLKAQKGE